MNVVVVTTFFPNSAQPFRTVFVKNLVKEMRTWCQISVVSPVRFVPMLAPSSALAAVRSVEVVDGITVNHPRMMILPRLGPLAGLFFGLSVFGLLRRMKQSHGNYLLHVHCAYPDAVGVALVAGILRLRFIVTAHGTDINVYSQRRIFRPQIKWALGRAAAIVSVSREIESKILSMLGDRAPRLEHIPCAGFDPNIFHPQDRESRRVEMHIAANARVVVFVGLMVPVKGIDILIKAWGQLCSRYPGSDDVLVLIGDGPIRPRAIRMVSELGLDNHVKITGALPQSKIAKWISAANFLCLPSFSEGMPNVIVESLASGIPVVATRVGGIPELIRDGQNGILVGSGDCQALMDAMLRAFEIRWNPFQLCETVAHLSWANIARLNCRLLEEISGEESNVHMG